MIRIQILHSDRLECDRLLRQCDLSVEVNELGASHEFGWLG